MRAKDVKIGMRVVATYEGEDQSCHGDYYKVGDVGTVVQTSGRSHVFLVAWDRVTNEEPGFYSDVEGYDTDEYKGRVWYANVEDLEPHSASVAADIFV